MRLVIVGGMLALAVSASLTAANAGGGGNRPCFLSEYSSRIAVDEYPCVCLSRCKGYGKPSPANGYGKPSPDIAACAAKCVAAKKAAQH